MFSTMVMHFVLLAGLVGTLMAGYQGRLPIVAMSPLTLGALAVRPDLGSPQFLAVIVAFGVTSLPTRGPMFNQAMTAVAGLWLTSNVVFESGIARKSDLGMQNTIVLVGVAVATTRLPRLVSSYWSKRWRLAAVSSLVVAILPMVSGLGAGSNNQLRVSVAGVAFQPGELAMLLAVFSVAGLFTGTLGESIASKYGRIGRMTFPPVVDIAPVLGVWSVLIGVLQVTGDLGTAAILWMAVTGTIAGTVGVRWAVAVIPIGVVTAMLAAPSLSPVATQRWMMWVSPWDQPIDQDASHLARALTAAIHGGLFGEGTEVASFGIVPEVVRDGSIVAVTSSLGLFGLGAVLGFLALWLGSWREAIRSMQPLDTNRGVASGVFAYLAGLCFFSVLGPFGLIPWSGLPVPVLARSGTITLILVGMSSLLHESSPLPGTEVRPASSARLETRLAAAALLACTASLTLHSVFGTPQDFDERREGYALRNHQVAEVLDSLGQPINASLVSDIPELGDIREPQVAALFGIQSIQPGQAVHTTLDAVLTSDLGDGLRAGGLPYAVVAVLPDTGDIVGVSASQGLNPLSTEFAPGSVQKLVIAAAMAENMAIDADVWVTSQGSSYEVAGHSIDGADCGANLVEALAYSCNAPFAAYGDIFVEQVNEMTEAFGFTTSRAAGDRAPIVQTGGLPLDASVGVYPAGADMPPLDAALSGIGQKDVLATPLGIAHIASVIANGGESVSFGLLAGDRETHRVVSQDVAAELTLGMRSSWEFGTARNVTRIPGVDVATKTGTADAWPLPTRSWCVLIVDTNPKIVVSAVVVGGSQGSETCDTIVKALLLHWVPDH